ncbi:MAG: WavE lipopolysaccharide synthesis family protein [Opitutales bacterium]
MNQNHQFTARPTAENTTVVLQGPVLRNEPTGRNETATIVRKLREVLPDSKLVLSTWEGEDTAEIDVDHVISSEDPGGLAFHNYNIVNNVNRQILSTIRGLKAVDTPFAIKLRTDQGLQDSRVLNLFGREKERSESFRIFRERIIIPSIYTRNPSRYDLPLLFHPSDMFQFGLTADLIHLWDIDLCDLEENNYYFLRNPRPDFDPRPIWTNQFAPEQYIWRSCIRKTHDMQFDHAWDVRGENPEISRLSLVNNFKVLSAGRIGLVNHKRVWPPYNLQLTLYTEGDWLKDYHRYCCGRSQWIFDGHRWSLRFRWLISFIEHWISGVRIRLGAYRQKFSNR